MKIYLHHLRSVPVPGRKDGYCLEGAKLFCARHGLDFKTLAKEGIDAEVLLQSGDAQAIALVEHARKGGE